ncbi:Flp/Fap pilin component [compost metagenome]
MELQTIKQAVVKFIKDEEGLTMVEYAVAGSLVTLACAAAFTNLGTAIAGAITGMIGRMTP